MPPSRRSPVSRARSAFAEEPEDREFFPPVGQGETSFRGGISSGLAATTRLMLDKLEADRDEQDTRFVENDYRRNEYGSRNRLLPFLEESQRAQYQAGTARAQADTRLEPLREQEQGAESRFKTAALEGDLADLPEAQALNRAQRKSAIEDLEAKDPWLSRLDQNTKNPAHLLAYDQFLASAPKELKSPQERQKYAYQQALQMAQDEADIGDIGEAVAAGEVDPGVFDELIEDVTGPQGQRLGSRIKQNLTPAQRNGIRTMVGKSRFRRAALAQQREDRMAAAAASQLRLSALREEIRSLQKDYSDMPTPELKADLDMLRKTLRDEFRNASGGGPEKSDLGDDFVPGKK